MLFMFIKVNSFISIKIIIFERMIAMDINFYVKALMYIGYFVIFANIGVAFLLAFLAFKEWKAVN